MSDINNEDEFSPTENENNAEPIEMGADNDQDFQEEDYYEDDFEEFDSGDDFDSMGQGENYQPEFQTTKKSGKLLYILIALVVLGGGGYALSSLFSGDTAPQSQQVPTLEATTQQQEETQIVGFDDPNGPLTPMPEFAEPPVQEMAQSDTLQPQEEGFVAPPSAVEEMANDSNLPALDTMQESFLDAADGFGIEEETIEEGFQDNNVANVVTAEQGIDIVEQAPEMVEATEDMGQMETETPTVQAEVKPVVIENAQQQAPAANEVDREILVALNTMSDTITEMQKTMNSMDVRMNALEAAEPRVIESSAPTSMPANVVTKGDLKSLMSSVDRLETKMLELQNNKPAPVAVPIVQPTPAPSPVLGARTPPQTPSQPVVSSVSWKLQSAEPNRAWLVREGSSAYVPVAVGDTIPGLGKVQFIGQQNGRWVVQGTQASVSE